MPRGPFPSLYVRHSTPVDMDLVKKIEAHCATANYSWRPDPDDDEHWKKLEGLLEKSRWMRPIGYSHDATELGWPLGQGVRVDIQLNQPRGHVDANGRLHPLPLFEQEGFRWLRVETTDLFIENKDQMTWFLRHARCPLPLVRPEFGFGDVDKAIRNNIGMTPERLAWPILLYGPAMADEVGHRRLLEAPAWKVEEWPDGSVWIQVGENPYAAKRSSVKKLAEHLSLKMPKQ
jgi:hypothetical protein